jgi:transcription termination factor NusB
MSQAEDSFTTRRRILLIQLLYSALISKFEGKELSDYLEKTALVSRYSKAESIGLDIAVTLTILKKVEELDKKINQLTDFNPPLLVLVILRVGIYEINFCQNQYNIATIIKDYLNIAMAFDHNLELGFINSILDKARL